MADNGQDRNYALDGMRGLAALVVFLAHTSNEGLLLFPFANFAGAGKEGVFLFFILSSYLLTSQFLNKGSKAWSMHVMKTYFWRRVLRIYPLYSVYLIIGLATTAFWYRSYPIPLSIGTFIEQLTLMRGDGVTWSIVAEFRWYLLLPLLAFTYDRVLRRSVIPCVMVTAVIVVVSSWMWDSSAVDTNPSQLGMYIPIFAVGALMAVLVPAWLDSQWRENKTARAGVNILVITAVVVLVVTIPSVTSLLLGYDTPRDMYHKYFILYSLAWSAVLFSAVSGNGILRRFFEHTSIRYIGAISFSVYLIHSSMLSTMYDITPWPVANAWAILGSTIALSHLAWTWIEKPAPTIYGRAGVGVTGRRYR